MVQVVRGVIGAGLMLGMAALPAAAQSLALPAADPVGIARSGAQVAYGYSLEAASANPALLISLKENRGIYLAAGLEMAATQQSLESNQHTRFSTDRNRAIGGFGAAFRLSPHLQPRPEAGRTLPSPRPPFGRCAQPLSRRRH